MSVRENTKSNGHRKARQVESGGLSRKFMHLTRGDLGSLNTREVSRGRSSEEALGNLSGAKDQRIGNATSTKSLSMLASRQAKREQHCNIGSLRYRRTVEHRMDLRLPNSRACRVIIEHETERSDDVR